MKDIEAKENSVIQGDCLEVMKDKILEEFEKMFQEKFMLSGHIPSPRGIQRVWSSAYPMRESIKQFISDSLDDYLESVIGRTEG